MGSTELAAHTGHLVLVVRGSTVVHVHVQVVSVDTPVDGQVQLVGRSDRGRRRAATVAKVTNAATAVDFLTVDAEEWPAARVIAVGEGIGERVTSATNSDSAGVSQVSVLLASKESNEDLIVVEFVLSEDVLS